MYRALFLDPETFGIIPPHGYRPEARQSVFAYQWLSYLSFQKQIYIQHGSTTGERQIGPYKLDGYYETFDGQRMALECHVFFVAWLSKMFL